MGDYLDEAERNRDAAASIGLVPAANQNGDQAIRVIGPRRIVMAFDPARDEVDLLRTVVQLVRASAVVASSRRDVEEIETAEERIRQAVIALTHIDTIRTASGSIRKNADKIDKECNSVQSSMERLLNQALGFRQCRSRRLSPGCWVQQVLEGGANRVGRAAGYGSSAVPCGTTAGSS